MGEGSAGLPIIWDVDAWVKPGAPGFPHSCFHVLEALPAAIYVTDAAGRIVFFNQAAAAFAGRTPDLDSDDWCVTWRLLWPDGRPMAHDECPMARALKENRPIRGETAIAERPDGTRVPFMAYPTPLHDASGTLIGAVNMLIDLTERDRAEAVLKQLNDTLDQTNDKLEQGVEERTRQLTETLTKLRESERQFRYLVEGVTDHAIFMLDPDGNVTHWNSGAERVKGYKEEEIIGQHFSRFYTAEDRQRGLPRRALTMAARHGSFDTEGWRLRRDGSRFWARIVINAIHDEAGQLIGFAKITRDMTERRVVEEQLHQAQKMETVGQLTNGIAHDFNNILAAIIPNLELAQAHVTEERISDYLQNAMHAADQGARLTDQLLRFSRRNDVHREIVDIGGLIATVCAMLPRTIGPNIAIERVLDGEVWHAVTDPGSLELALLNLAINARDAMPSGGTLTIATRNLARGSARLPSDLDPGNYLMISVTDTGTGMSEEVRSQSLDPFFTTKAPGKGTGLGLSMVYGFAKQSGGTVIIDSEMGKGTTVRIYLPRAGNPSATQTEGPHQDETGAGPPSRILVVDDDASVRDAISSLVRTLGHEVTEVASGQAALDVLERDRRFDLLIIDFAMPVLHGGELANLARQRIPGVPMLFVSGDAEALGDGTFDDAQTLKKPFRQTDLAQKLRDLLRPETFRRDGVRPPTANRLPDGISATADLRRKSAVAADVLRS
jgi:PAS domain S-box-containing protein